MEGRQCFYALPDCLVCKTADIAKSQSASRSQSQSWSAQAARATLDISGQVADETADIAKSQSVSRSQSQSWSAQAARATLDISGQVADEGGPVQNLANRLPSCVSPLQLIEEDHGTAARLARTLVRSVL